MRQRYSSKVISSIGNDAIAVTRTDIFNANNGVLLPGFIDSHIHLHDPSNLKQLAQYGVTTGLDMATWPQSLVHSLRAAVEIGGTADFRTPGLATCAPGSTHSHILPADALVASHEDAKRFVQARVDEGAAYTKIIADVPGFDQEILNLLVVCAPPLLIASLLKANTDRSKVARQESHSSCSALRGFPTSSDCTS
jgi:imidazolonepropionase-like amidohydrolase